MCYHAVHCVPIPGRSELKSQRRGLSLFRGDGPLARISNKAYYQGGFQSRLSQGQDFEARFGIDGCRGPTMVARTNPCFERRSNW